MACQNEPGHGGNKVLLFCVSRGVGDGIGNVNDRK